MCMKENLIHSRTCVYNINYHVVWSVKYRRKILNAEVEKYLKELVEQIAMDKGFMRHLNSGTCATMNAVISRSLEWSITLTGMIRKHG